MIWGISFEMKMPQMDILEQEMYNLNKIALHNI